MRNAFLKSTDNDPSESDNRPDNLHGAVDEALTATKFAPPKLNAEIVPRDRLLQKKSALDERKLMLITARAGFGKTTLMVQLRQKILSSGDTLVWLSLSSEDQNWIYYWTHFIAAFRASGFLIQDEGFSYGDRDQIRAVLLQIVEAIADHPGEVYLFIDDFHNADSDTQRTIQRLIDVSTENFHVAIASREIIDFSLGKLKSDDQIVEISEELKFTLDESRLFLQKQLGADFADEKIRLIHDECGGWPASLNLLAHSLKHKTSGDLSSHELIRRAGSLRSYINDQVFARMPENIIAIWQKLSICHRFNLDLACTLTEPAEYQLVAKVLQDDQLLLSTVDSSEMSPWYRFLPLFAEMLQERLFRSDPAIVRSLHDKAGKWFADRGFVLEAIHHARNSPDSTQLEALLDKVPIELRSLRWAGAIREMLSDIDPSTLQSRRAKVIGSWTLFVSGAVREGEVWAEQVIAEDPGDDADFALHQHALKATVAFFHDDSPLFFSLYETLPVEVGNASILRNGVTTEAMAFLNALGRYEEVRAFVTKSISTEEYDDEWALFVQAFGAVSYLNEGDIHEGLSQLKFIMERAMAAHSDRSISVAFCATYIAEALYELGMTSDAHPLLIGREAELRRFSPDPFIKFCITKSRIMRDREGWKKAAAYLDEQIEYSRNVWGPRARAWLIAEAAMLGLRSQGAAAGEAYRRDLETIAKSVEEKEGVCTEILSLNHEVQGRFLLRSHKYEEALQALHQANEYALRFRQLRSQVRISLLKAAAIHAMGDMDAVDELLVWSIETSQQRDIVRTFQDELTEVGNVIAKRAPHLQISSTTRAYLDMLCTMEIGLPKTSKRIQKSPKDIFTKRELEIIDLLTRSMSNKRIALTLAISPATVKWNLQNIFQKLCVGSRYDVITWARKNLAHNT